MNRSLRSWIVIAVGVTMVASSDAADIPRLGAIYYGKTLSPYGYPSTAADGVTLSAVKIGGVEASYYDIGPVIGPGINYRLQVNVVASGSGGDGTSVPEGGTVQLRATIGGQPVNMIGNTNIVVASSAVDRRDYILGADDDGDGLPDAWEQFAVDAMKALGMGAGVTNIAQFDPHADYDADGVSNEQEFFAGTLPFLGSDSLRIDLVSLVTNGTMRIRFLGNEGFIYQVNASSNLAAGSWQVEQIGSDPMAPSANSMVAGDGSLQSVYMYYPTNGLAHFLRLIVK